DVFSLQCLDEDFGAAKFFGRIGGIGRRGGRRSDFSLGDFHFLTFEYFSDEKPGVSLGRTLVASLWGLRLKPWAHRITTPDLNPFHCSALLVEQKWDYGTNPTGSPRAAAIIRPVCNPHLTPLMALPRPLPSISPHHTW